MTLTEATILIVDDEAVLTLTMGLVFRQQGAATLTAENGVEALALLEQQHVDVMVCDQNMPVMDGRTLLRTLHARGRCIPTLFFAGMDRQDANLLEEMGVRLFVNKPIPPTALIEAVERVLATL